MNIDLTNTTPHQIIFLASIFYIVSLYIITKLLSWWFMANLRRSVEEFRSQYASEVERLRNKLSEYERTHRTMV